MPLPLASQLDSVAVGMNTPVLPTSELTPTSAVPSTTPAVSSVWLAGADVAERLRRRCWPGCRVPDQ